MNELRTAAQQEQDIEDAIEAAYWHFDARKKGLNEWASAPQSERDAFKAEARKLAKGYFPTQQAQDTKREMLAVADAFIRGKRAALAEPQSSALHGWVFKRNADGSIGIFAPPPKPGESQRTSDCVGPQDRDLHELLGKLADHMAALAEPTLQTCNCRWDGEVQVQQCTLHEAHVDAIHEWAERAKKAEKKLAALAEPVQEQCRGDPGECEFNGGCMYACAATPQRPAEPVLVESALQAVAEKIGDQYAVWYGIGARDVEEVLREAVRHGLVHGALAQPVQEPVAEARYDGTLHWIEPHGVGLHRIQGPLYTAPPQRKPLTEEEIFAIENDIPDDVISDRAWTIWLARAVEAAHGIKEDA